MVNQDRGSPASLATQLTRVALDDVYDKELALSNQPSISSMSHVSRQRPAPIPVAGSPRPSQNRSINDSFEWHYNELVEDDPAPFSNLNEMDKRLHVLVIGAGLGGLSAAIACARQGFAVTLLEKVRFGTTAFAALHQLFVDRTVSCRAPESRHTATSSLSDATATKFWAAGGSCPLSGTMRAMEDGGCSSTKMESSCVKKTCVTSLLSMAPLYFKVCPVQTCPDRLTLTRAIVLRFKLGHRAQFLGVFGSEARCLKVRVRLNTEVIAYTDSKKQPSVTTASGEVIFADVSGVFRCQFLPLDSTSTLFINPQCIVVADGVHSLGRDLLEKELAAADRNPVPASAKATPPSEYSVHRSLVRADKVAANPETACES